MKPKLIFHAEIINDKVKIIFWDLDKPKKELMPISSLKKKEIKEIFGKNKNIKNLEFVPEEKIGKLKMRDKILKKYNKAYKRR